MKRLKRWVVAFLAWEFLTLIKKDQSFKQWVVEKTGRDKAKHILDWLFHFNKQIVEDVKEHFDTNALQDHIEKWAAFVETELQNLEKEMSALKWKKNMLTEELITTFQDRFTEIQQTAILIKDSITAFPLEEKINELKKLLESLAKWIKKQ
jgi:predicted  nucleic acid-binding Zn-ribbon protein